MLPHGNGQRGAHPEEFSLLQVHNNYKIAISNMMAEVNLTRFDFSLDCGGGVYPPLKIFKIDSTELIFTSTL